jgi:hypothetical protein
MRVSDPCGSVSTAKTRLPSCLAKPAILSTMDSETEFYGILVRFNAKRNVRLLRLKTRVSGTAWCNHRCNHHGGFVR